LRVVFLVRRGDGVKKYLLLTALLCVVITQAQDVVVVTDRESMVLDSYDKTTERLALEGRISLLEKKVVVLEKMLSEVLEKLRTKVQNLKMEFKRDARQLTGQLEAMASQLRSIADKVR
jgi:hypothetical protein